MAVSEAALFCENLWRMLLDGGHWGVPRSGLMYRKDEAAMQLVLFHRLPWEAEMPMTPEQLREQQDSDHAMNVEMFGMVGVTVIDAT